MTRECNKHGTNVPSSNDKKCVVCDSEFVPVRVRQNTCSDECRVAREAFVYQEALKRGRQRKFEESLVKFKDAHPDEYVACGVCGLRASNLGAHPKMHGLTNDEYIEKYGSMLSANSIKSVQGANNPAYQHGGKYSPFSKKFVKYVDLSENEIQNRIEGVVDTSMTTRSDNGNDTTTLEYYIKQGMSEDEAKDALRERQRTFNLDKCIEKYGEFEGRIRWQERQDKWMASLDAKTPEEKAEINRKKIPSISGRSRTEKEIFAKIAETFGDKVSNQYKIRRPDLNRFFAYDIQIGDVIIEYNGDYWHANPEKFAPDHAMNYPGLLSGKLAETVWDEDAEKIALAESSGFRVLVIWEADYLRDRRSVIQHCIDFINEYANL